MIKRQLYLVGYDISDPKRLRHALKAVRVHAQNGQKSFYECSLTSYELPRVIERLGKILDPEHDRAILVPLRADAQPLTLGAVQRTQIGDCIVLS